MATDPTCPHCGADMQPIETPLDSTWGGEIHYVCFTDECCSAERCPLSAKLYGHWKVIQSMAEENVEAQIRRSFKATGDIILEFAEPGTRRRAVWHGKLFSVPFWTTSV